MGSDESHINISLIVRDKVTRQCPQTTTFEEKGEPKRNRTEVLLLAKPAHRFSLSVGRYFSERKRTDKDALVSTADFGISGLVAVSWASRDCRCRSHGGQCTANRQLYDLWFTLYFSQAESVDAFAFELRRFATMMGIRHCAFAFQF